MTSQEAEAQAERNLDALLAADADDLLGFIDSLTGAPDDFAMLLQDSEVVASVARLRSRIEELARPIERAAVPAPATAPGTAGNMFGGSEVLATEGEPPLPQFSDADMAALLAEAGSEGAALDSAMAGLASHKAAGELFRSLNRIRAVHSSASLARMLRAATKSHAEEKAAEPPLVPTNPVLDHHLDNRARKLDASPANLPYLYRDPAI
jgi:hypothetical protein